jgi:LPS-assembly lipoprotein
MSSPERLKRHAGMRAFAAGVMVAAALAAGSGCTVRPLYSDAAPVEGTVTGSIGAELSTVAVKPVTNRVGQEVRNHLIFLFNGGKGDPAAPRYTLDIIVVAISEATTNIQVNKENEPTSAILTTRASYRLTDSKGTMVATGNRQFMSAYDVPRQEFAALRAQRDAENRSARELAELVRMAVAQDLSKRPAS